MTIYVQYYKNGGFQSQPPPPVVRAGSRIGARLFYHNDSPDGTSKQVKAVKRVISPDGNRAAYEEETQTVSFGAVANFPILTNNTSQSGEYLAEFDAYEGTKWILGWKGNPQVSPQRLIATVETQPEIPVDNGDDIVVPPPEVPPTDGEEYEIVKVGSGNFKNVEDLQARTDWDANFRNGEHGLIKLRFPVPLPEDLPDWLRYTMPFNLLAAKISGQPYLELSKAGISDYMNSYLPSKGVKLWRSVYWEGSYICIPFTTGLAALAILAICGGIALIIAAVGFTVALYKVGVKYIETEKEKELEGQDQILDRIGAVEDPELQAALLAKYLNLKYTPTDEQSIWGEIFGKPILIIGITIAVIIIAIVAMKLLRR